MKSREQVITEMIEKVDVDTVKMILMETSERPKKIDVSWHIRKWAENKWNIYVRMGERLKISENVECALSESQVRSLIRELCDKYTTRLPFITPLFTNWQDLKAEDIVANRVPKDFFVLGQKFQAGSKLSKALGKLSLDGKAVNDFQTELSMVIQSLKGQGKAMLSIDPIDYLTMSANNSGWRSCHNIINGEFRAGCMSYMCDASTAIAYVTMNSKATIGEAVFDNKMWRQCVYFSEDTSFAIQSRQYPNTNKNNRKAISSIINDLYPHDMKAVVRNTYSSDSDSDTEAFYEFNKEIVRDVQEEDSLHYNDILRCSFKQFILMMPADKDPTYEWASSSCYCAVGSEVQCIDHPYEFMTYSDCLCARRDGENCYGAQDSLYEAVPPYMARPIPETFVDDPFGAEQPFPSPRREPIEQESSSFDFSF